VKIKYYSKNYIRITREYLLPAEKLFGEKEIMIPETPKGNHPLLRD
jgi:hypothetical protein